MQVTICCHYQVDFIFCFCIKATDATAKKLTIKHASSRSCGSQFLEAAGGWCLEGGGIQRLVVASRGWW